MKNTLWTIIFPLKWTIKENIFPVVHQEYCSIIDIYVQQPADIDCFVSVAHSN